MDPVTLAKIQPSMKRNKACQSAILGGLSQQLPLIAVLFALYAEGATADDAAGPTAAAVGTTTPLPTLFSELPSVFFGGTSSGEYTFATAGKQRPCEIS